LGAILVQVIGAEGKLKMGFNYLGFGLGFPVGLDLGLDLIGVGLNYILSSIFYFTLSPI